MTLYKVFPVSVGEMIQQIRALVLERTWVTFLAPTWFILISNSSSGRYPLLASPGPAHTGCSYIHGDKIFIKIK